MLATPVLGSGPIPDDAMSSLINRLRSLDEESLDEGEAKFASAQDDGETVHESEKTASTPEGQDVLDEIDALFGDEKVAGSKKKDGDHSDMKDSEENSEGKSKEDSDEESDDESDEKSEEASEKSAQMPAALRKALEDEDGEEGEDSDEDSDEDSEEKSKEDSDEESDDEDAEDSDKKEASASEEGFSLSKVAERVETAVIEEALRSASARQAAAGAEKFASIRQRLEQGHSIDEAIRPPTSE